MNSNIVIKRALCDDVKISLKKYIQTYDLARTDKLPSENDLSKLFGVSRITIRRVLDDLESEGLVLRIHGRGTYINPAAAKIKMNLLESGEFQSLLKRSGYKVHTEILNISEEKITSSLATLLRQPLHTYMVVVETLHYADNHPTILVQDKIPMPFFKTIPSKEIWEATPFFSVIHDYCNIIMCRVLNEFQAVSQKSAVLEIPFCSLMENDSLLRTSNIVYDQENNPVISGTTFFDTNYIRYNLISNYNSND